MGQAKRKQEAARRLVESVDLSIFQTSEVRAAVREHMVRRGIGFQDGQHGERADAVRSESSPAREKGESGASAEPGASRPAAAPADQPAALVPDDLCDIDDLPDCLIGGVHQPHCRHAGKPVTKGGNP